MDDLLNRLRALSPQQRAQVHARLAEASSGALVTMPRVADGEAVALTMAQEGVWTAQQLAPHVPVYSAPALFRIRGPLDIARLRAAVASAAAKHAVFRTEFAATSSGPVQRLGERVRLSLLDVDATEPHDAERAAQYADYRFDRDPLITAVLARLGADDHALAFRVHHIVFDGWSRDLLMRDIAANYRSQPIAERSDVPRFIDYAAYERTWRDSREAARELDYWASRLDGHAGSPLGLVRPLADASLDGAVEQARLDDRVAGALADGARTCGATTFAWLLSAYCVALHEHAQDDLCVGVPVAGRHFVETESIVGLFASLLPFRIDLSGDPRFSDLVRRVRDVTLSAAEHQRVPGHVLAAARRGAVTRWPPFEACFAYEQRRSIEDAFADLTIEQLAPLSPPAMHPLMLFADDRGDGLHLSMIYDTARLERHAVRRLMRACVHVLERVHDSPETPIRELQRGEGEEAVFQAIARGRRRSIGTELVRVERPTPSPPLLVTAAVSGVDVCEWIQRNEDRIDGWLHEHGAVLFRGFHDMTRERFARAAERLTTTLMNYVEGSSPRTRLDAKLYTSTEYPADQPISLHNELSYAHCWPGRLLFFCETPAAEGGETPLVDSRRLLATLPPSITEAFAAKGVMYLRTLHGGRGAGLSWQAVFETDDRAAIEAYCRHAVIEFEWTADGGVKTVQRRPAVVRHPVTGEQVWFNQVDQWHPSNVGQSVASALAAQGYHDLPIDARYGDGSPLDPGILDEIRRVTWSQAAARPWQRGDLLLVDNMLVAHGRRPFRGARRILVMMGSPVALADVVEQGA